MAKKFYRTDLGKGYYAEYREVSNGFNGKHKVNMMLYKDDGFFVCEITDTDGYFVDFPGVKEGAWRKKLVGDLILCARFHSSIWRLDEHFFGFAWQVQPDGRYWADEQGFGMENDEPIWLYSKLDEDGHFVIPFTEQRF